MTDETISRQHTIPVTMYTAGTDGQLYAAGTNYPTIALEYDLLQSQLEVVRKYGDRASVSQRAESLNKFGLTTNADSDEETTIMTLLNDQRHEAYVSDNLITTISSSSTNDTTQTMVLSGQTISGGLLTSVTQNVDLNGQNQVTLDTPLARINRVAHATSNINAYEGTLYIYQDDTVVGGVPQTDAKVHMIASPTYQQSEKAATSIANDEYLFVNRLSAGVTRNAGTAKVDIQFQIRPVGGVFRPLSRPFTINSQHSSGRTMHYKPHLIVPKNSDVRMIVTSDTNNTTVFGEFAGYMAQVIS